MLTREVKKVERFQCQICHAVYSTADDATDCANDHAEVIRVAVKYGYNTLPKKIWLTYSDGSYSVIEQDEEGVGIDWKEPFDKEKYIVVFEKEN